MRIYVFSAYAVFLIFLTIFSYAFIDQNLLYLSALYTGFAFLQRKMTTVLYVVLLTLLTCFYGYFVHQVIKGRLNLPTVKKLVFLSICILFFSYPAMLSYDIFNYIATAKVTYFYHENPYIIMPIEFLNDPLLLFTRAANKTALYGPTWLLLTGIPFFLGLHQFIAILFLFKFFIILFYIGTVYVFYKLAKDNLRLVLFALHPLVLIEVLVSSHNDIVMIFLALLAYVFIQMKRIALAWIFLFLSIGVKFATVFLVPVFIYLTYQYIKQRKISWPNVYIVSTVFMFCIFLLSPLREEMYPWYALWFLPFAILSNKKRFFVPFSLGISVTLLLRYIPFMLTGTYFGHTPLIRFLVTFGLLPFSFFIFHKLLNKDSLQKT